MLRELCYVKLLIIPSPSRAPSSSSDVVFQIDILWRRCWSKWSCGHIGCVQRENFLITSLQRLSPWTGRLWERLTTRTNLRFIIGRWQYRTPSQAVSQSFSTGRWVCTQHKYRWSANEDNDDPGSIFFKSDPVDLLQYWAYNLFIGQESNGISHLNEWW